MKINKREAGFTLVEVLVGISLSLFLITIMITFFLITKKVTSVETKQLSERKEILLFLEKYNYILDKSRYFNIAIEGNNLFISGAKGKIIADARTIRVKDIFQLDSASTFKIEIPFIDNQTILLEKGQNIYFHDILNTKKIYTSSEVEKINLEITTGKRRYLSCYTNPLISSKRFNNILE